MSHSFAALIRECLCRYRSSQRALADGIHVNPGYVARMLAELEESIDMDPGIVSKILSGEDLPSGQDVRIKHVINMIRWLHDQQYAGRKEVVELLEAAGMPQLNPRDPEQARLQEQLNREFPRTHRLPSPHCRFGELLCKFLSRIRGFSLYKLGDECESIGGPGVVYDMMNGKRLTGPKARKRVVSMIDCLCNPSKMRMPDGECLLDLAEANALLMAACIPPLSPEDREERRLIDQLIPKTICYRRDRLIAGRDADDSAWILGNLAIEYERKEAVRALWDAICQADDKLPLIIDHCAFTVGRIVLETSSPAIEDICFDILDRSTDRDCAPIMRKFFSDILDKFAFTVGRVRDAETEKDRILKLARRFVDDKASSNDKEVRDKYIYVRRQSFHLTV